jgi:putative oxidoreductase
VVAPIPLIIGLWVQPAAIIVAINMLTAILLVHIGEIFSLNKGVCGRLSCRGCS